jgi:hypothetical protein
MLSQINPIHTTQSYLSKIRFNTIHHPRLGLLVVSFLLAFPPISYKHSSSLPIRATCPAHVILLNLIIIIIIGEEYKLWSYSFAGYNLTYFTVAMFVSVKVTEKCFINILCTFATYPQAKSCTPNSVGFLVITARRKAQFKLLANLDSFFYS